jgi:hypothetical protein
MCGEQAAVLGSRELLEILADSRSQPIDGRLVHAAGGIWRRSVREKVLNHAAARQDEE